MLSYLYKEWITAKANDIKMVNWIGEGTQGVVIGGCRR
jgi:hypothetical protein